MDNLEEMDKFLEGCTFQDWTKKKQKIRTDQSQVLWLKFLEQTQVQAQMASQVNSREELTPIILKLFKKL